MATDKQQFLDMLKEGNQKDQSMGAIEAVKEGIQAIAPGLSLANILSDVGAELGRLGVQGQMEMASVLFNGSAFVPYGPGQYTPTPEHAPEQGAAVEASKQQPEVEQNRGGMEM
jgi:hypothetical protein